MVSLAGAEGVVRFESLDSAFAADISFDDAGAVLHYPGIARLVTKGSLQSA